MARYNKVVPKSAENKKPIELYVTADSVVNNLDDKEPSIKSAASKEANQFFGQISTVGSGSVIKSITERSTPYSDAKIIEIERADTDGHTHDDRYLKKANVEATVTPFITGQINKLISRIDVEFALSDSMTIAPSNGWQTSAPAHQPGKYMWQRTKTTLKDGSESIDGVTCIQGAKGERGLGVRPNLLNGYKDKVFDLYHATDRFYYRSVFKDLIGSTFGAVFSADVEVVEGVASKITIVYYNRVAGKHHAHRDVPVNAHNKARVSIYIPPISADEEYPKHYELLLYAGQVGHTAGVRVRYSHLKIEEVREGESQEATTYIPHVDELKGDPGKDGKRGDNGISITNVDAEFAINNSATVAPVSMWSTDAPTLSADQQLWTRSKITYSNNESSYTTPINITPKQGADGTGIESITKEFALSSSKDSHPSNGWSATQPSWERGKYLWSRTKIVYKNPASTVYTGYAVSSEWEAINAIQIGDRNLLLNSGVPATNSWYGTASYVLSTAAKDLKEGELVTLVVKCNLGEDKVHFMPYNSDVSVPVRGLKIDRSSIDENGIAYVTGAWDKTDVASQNTKLTMYAMPDSGTSESTIEWIKLVRGTTTSREWTPAPEDIEARLSRVATSSNAGVVKIGSGINVSSDGTISVSNQTQELAWDKITGKPAEFTPKSHTHPEFNTFSQKGHTHTGLDIQGVLNLDNIPSIPYDKLRLDVNQHFLRKNVDETTTGSLTARKFSELSDARLKEAIVDENNLLSKVLSIQPVTYSMIGSDSRELGLIAQDVEKIFPDVVITSDDGYKSIDYARLSVAAIGSLRELYDIVRDLTEELFVLRKKVYGY